MATSSAVLFLLLAVFAAGASAATFNIHNNCGFTIWPAAVPGGGGVFKVGGFELGQGQTSTINVPQGTVGRIWARTGCFFNGDRGSCQTGDCNGLLSCTLPAGVLSETLAEFNIGGDLDFYDISVIEGYNLAMDFSCSNGDALQCRDPSCGPPQALRHPDDAAAATHDCSGNNNYQITFCP